MRVNNDEKGRAEDAGGCLVFLLGFAFFMSMIVMFWSQVNRMELRIVDLQKEAVLIRTDLLKLETCNQ